MSLILSDQPGLLGPKVEVSFFSYHVACFIERRVLDVHNIQLYQTRKIVFDHISKH